MNTNTSADDRTIKQIIQQELPLLMKKDKTIRQWIVKLANEQADAKTKELETRTESKFDIILDELRKDRETNYRKWEKNQEELRMLREAQEQKWEEHNRKWEEDRKAQEQKWEAQEQKWEAQEQKWEAQERKWEESRQDFKEEMEKSRKQFDLKLNSTLGAIGSRWGIRTEASYRNALKGILEEVAPVFPA